MREGKGTFVKVDGTSFVGLYKADKRADDFGMVLLPSGDSYHGTLSFSLFLKAMMIIPMPCLVHMLLRMLTIGTWKNGKKHGSGVYVWANGERYDGQWADGKLNGIGEFTYTNGNKYKGPQSS